jgi:hypothetical protein
MSTTILAIDLGKFNSVLRWDRPGPGEPCPAGVDSRSRGPIAPTDCARAPSQVRLPPQTFRKMTPKRTANSARQLVASSPG